MSEQPFLVVLLCLIRSTLSGRELVQRGSLRRNDALFSLSPFGAVSAPSQTAKVGDGTCRMSYAWQTLGWVLPDEQLQLGTVWISAGP